MELSADKLRTEARPDLIWKDEFYPAGYDLKVSILAIDSSAERIRE